MQEYFMVVSKDDSQDMGCFVHDEDVKIGDIFAIQCVDVGLNEQDKEQIRFKLVKIKPKIDNLIIKPN